MNGNEGGEKREVKVSTRLVKKMEEAEAENEKKINGASRHEDMKSYENQTEKSLKGFPSTIIINNTSTSIASYAHMLTAYKNMS